MATKIVIIQGHPDPAPRHFCRALAEAYARGATQAGHAVTALDIATLDLPPLRSRAQWEAAPSPAIRQCQDAIGGAQHLVIVYPLWLGSMPALLKAFFEQVFRPGFAVAPTGASGWKHLLSGRSARIVVTMGMPALVYRWYFAAHSLKSLERNILGFCGIHPIRESIVGMVEAMSAEKRERWLSRMEQFGRDAR